SSSCRRPTDPECTIRHSRSAHPRRLSSQERPLCRPRGSVSLPSPAVLLGPSSRYGTGRCGLVSSPFSAAASSRPCLAAALPLLPTPTPPPSSRPPLRPAALLH